MGFNEAPKMDWRSLRIDCACSGTDRATYVRKGERGMAIVDIDECSGGIKSVRSSSSLQRGIPIDRSSWQPAGHIDVKNDIP